MKQVYRNVKTSGELRLIAGEGQLDRVFYGKDRKDKLLTIAWNKGQNQYVSVDGVRYPFPRHTVLCLMINQSFHFSSPEHIVAWQFNRDFYCIVDHDQEVSCVGFLFYGSLQTMFTRLDAKEQAKIDLLLRVFQDEFDTVDNIQEEMLRMLLKRLIIIVTRLAKQQFIHDEELTGKKLDIIRQFNLLVENHYKTQHQVKFYAGQLHRSPKTLSNLFALYNKKSPLAVIQERVILEAKRLLVYSHKSAKEIAYELGFDDVAYFSKFFKKLTGMAPTDFRKGQAGLQTAEKGTRRAT